MISAHRAFRSSSEVMRPDQYRSKLSQSISTRSCCRAFSNASSRFEPSGEVSRRMMPL
jgi:hypothetical protein